MTPDQRVTSGVCQCRSTAVGVRLSLVPRREPFTQETFVAGGHRPETFKPSEEQRRDMDCISSILLWSDVEVRETKFVVRHKYLLW